jgi:hypothetical protein
VEATKPRDFFHNMTLWDVISGRKPLLKSESIKQAISEIETDFAALINAQGANNWRRGATPSPSLVIADQQANENPIQQAAARFTLSATLPIKIGDTHTERRKFAITVPQQGQTAFISHNRLRLTNQAGGINEGIPITAGAVGEPALTSLDWIGEIWAIGSADGVLIDVEML